jgi:hypothetical protein
MRFAYCLLTVPAVCLAATVPTANYDNTRDGVNTAESILTPANIAEGLAKLGTWTLDGPVLSQPLYGWRDEDS